MSRTTYRKCYAALKEDGKQNRFISQPSSSKKIRAVFKHPFLHKCYLHLTSAEAFVYGLLLQVYFGSLVFHVLLLTLIQITGFHQTYSVVLRVPDLVTQHEDVFDRLHSSSIRLCTRLSVISCKKVKHDNLHITVAIIKTHVNYLL